MAVKPERVIKTLPEWCAFVRHQSHAPLADKARGDPLLTRAAKVTITEVIRQDDDVVGFGR